MDGEFFVLYNLMIMTFISDSEVLLVALYLGFKKVTRPALCQLQFFSVGDEPQLLRDEEAHKDFLLFVILDNTIALLECLSRRSGGLLAHLRVTQWTVVCWRTLRLS
jgi:hypothetical protein